MSKVRIICFVCFFHEILTSGDGNLSLLVTPFNTISHSDSSVGGTTPGQSIKKTRRINVMYCHTFVSPGTGAALQTIFFFKVLITEDFPTFGYPIKPTDICFFSLCNCEN